MKVNFVMTTELESGVSKGFNNPIKGVESQDNGLE